MTISVLYFGDIVGRPGLEAIRELLPELKAELQPDVVFANIENASHGHGVSKVRYDELVAAGIDGFSGGDHIWNNPDIMKYLDRQDVLIARPANYSDAPGKGYCDIIIKGKRVRVISLLGRVFMSQQVENPFRVIDDLLSKTHPKADVTILDMHAEATSEKRSMATHLDGRVSLQVGTHTHVPTADAQILPGGMGFISDLGMVGPTDSSLGAAKEPVLRNFLTGMPWRYSLATGQCELGAVFARINVETGKTEHIQHIRRITKHSY
jgi:2',3'-cyclic-nucleotide 2'-phosphodiesterase